MQETRFADWRNSDTAVNFLPDDKDVSNRKWARRKILGVIPKWFLNFALPVRRHAKRHGRIPNLVKPEMFTDKVLCRILFDRRPVLTEVADKAGVRSYVSARLGEELLPKVYCLTTDPDSISFDDLPEKFVIKPTHGSGWVRVITDRSTLDAAALVQTCKEWLGQNFYEKTGEWPYKNIRPQIIIEEYIDDGCGIVPIDYKVFVFGGVVEFIQIDSDRFVYHRRRLYDRNWEKLDVRYEYDDIIQDIPRPHHLEQMIAAAETLGAGLDFIRADFYDTKDQLYFGELTTTPDCGMGRFSPPEFDLYLGSKWKQPPMRALRNQRLSH